MVTWYQLWYSQGLVNLKTTPTSPPTKWGRQTMYKNYIGKTDTWLNLCTYIFYYSYDKDLIKWELRQIIIKSDIDGKIKFDWF